MQIEWVLLPVSAPARRFFISYSSRDAEIAAAAEQMLEKHSQLVWRDRRILRTGDKWRDEIAAGIASADDFLLLLTQNAAGSVEVEKEVRLARQQGKRTHVFANFDARQQPIFELVRDINVMWLNQQAPAAMASEIEHHLFGEGLRAHPLEPREFERRYAQCLLPSLDQGGFTADIAASYLAYYSRSSSNTPMLVMNYALAAAHLQRWELSVEILSALGPTSNPALTNYLMSLFTVGGRRPRHLMGRNADKAVAHAEAAFRECRSPLIALHLISLYWDLGIKRGESVATLFAASLQRLLSSPERVETRRYLQLSPLQHDLDLPMDRHRLIQTINNYLGDKNGKQD